MYYYAGKPTGSWYEDGTPEIGNTCGHRHKTARAACSCALKQEAPGFREWGTYTDQDRPVTWMQED